MQLAVEVMVMKIERQDMRSKALAMAVQGDV
jgi:hypothetical protein